MTDAKLPPYVYGRECGVNEKVWPEQAMRAYAKFEQDAARYQWLRRRGVRQGEASRLEGEDLDAFIDQHIHEPDQED